jgi:septal ring factor EnvC (AmiA/AmiB activator)
MKKYLASIVLLLLGSIGISFAYTPSEHDTQQLNQIKGVLNTVSTNDLRNYYKQFAQLQKTVALQNEQLNYLLTNLRDYSYSQFSILKNLAKQQSKQEKSDFLNTYKNNITLNQDIYSNCL